MIKSTENKPVIYPLQADPVIKNADKSNLKQRPFIVDKESTHFRAIGMSAMV